MAEGARANAKPSGRRRCVARRHHGERHRRTGPGRIHPQGAQERDGAHHPSHRSTGAGAGAASHRRLRHQRLQGEDRAHGRQAVHRFDRRAAQSPATRAHGSDTARAGNHHRGGVRPVRLQVDATAGGGGPHPDRVVAQCRLRGNFGAA